MSFCCLYRRDPWLSTLVPPTYWAIVEASPNITYFDIEEEDLDGNKEVLGPLPDKNGNRQQAAKQKYKNKDN
jgi:hypothetical protein